MKKTLLLLFILIGIVSCYEGSDEAELIKVTPGGCATEKGGSLRSDQIPGDTVTCSLKGDTLTLYAGFMGNCCDEYSVKGEAISGCVTVTITTTTPGMCDCICYFTYTFVFQGINNQWSYEVMINDKLFSGTVEN